MVCSVSDEGAICVHQTGKMILAVRISRTAFCGYRVRKSLHMSGKVTVCLNILRFMRHTQQLGFVRSLNEASPIQTDQLLAPFVAIYVILYFSQTSFSGSSP